MNLLISRIICAKLDPSGIINRIKLGKFEESTIVIEPCVLFKLDELSQVFIHK